jgi:hypothetical protein
MKYLLTAKDGVIFRVTQRKGKHCVHIHQIPEDKDMKTVFSKCIKKFDSRNAVKRWLELKYEAMTDEESFDYLVKYYRGEGEQKEREAKGGNFILVRAVTKQVFRKRGNTWVKHGSYGNPRILAGTLRYLERQGVTHITEHGVVRYWKVKLEDMKDIHNWLIIEEEHHPIDGKNYARLDIKKANSAIFWNKRS